METRTLFYFLIFGIFGFCLGQGAIVMWPEWSAWTWWGIAVGVLPLLAVPTIWDYRREIVDWLRKAPSQTETNFLDKVNEILSEMKPFIIIVIFLLALVILQGVARQHIYESKNWNMIHPSLSLEEQKRVDAECSLKAMEIVGTSDMKFAERLDYRNACLASKGFIRENTDLTPP